MKKNLSVYLNNCHRVLLLAMLAILSSFSVVIGSVPYTSYLENNDEKLVVINATANAYQPGEEASKTIDGESSTIYHSPYNKSGFPISLTYNFASEGISMDYVLYSTRQDGNSNGNFKEVEVYVKYKNENQFHKRVAADLRGAPGSHKLKFDTTQENVISVKMVVSSGQNGFASCSEMNFYKINSTTFDVLSIFKDKTCSELKPGIEATDIAAISNLYYKELATRLFENNYSSAFRVQEYKAWPHPDDFSSNNRVGTYSLCDNPTGIYAETGDTVVVFVGDTHGFIGLTLRYQNLDRPDGDGFYEARNYGINEGLNKIVVENPGLFYVQYHTPNHLTAKSIKIHFPFSKVNGYFDSQKHQPSDWTKLLGAAKYKYFDVLGEYAHLTFPTDKFRKNAATTGAQLIDSYDELVYMEREFMGYYTYPNRNPYNRSYFSVMYHNYMYSSGYHTGYDISTMDGLTNNANLRKYPWGPAHEVGHSNQHTPLFKWVGTTEVTNNLHSLYIQTSWGNTSRLTQENRYEYALQEIIGNKTPHAQADIWHKLVPIWQLQLYFVNLLEKPNTFQKIYEAARTWNVGSTNGDHQLKFTKMVCDSAQVDLTDFFEAWGFYTPVNATIDDYTPANLTVTPQSAGFYKGQIKNKNYPVPPYKLQYLNDNNVEVYVNKKQIIPGTAVRIGSTIKLSGWENAVAFEAWQGNEMVGVTQSDKISFINEYDENSKVFAIQYDGTRVEVVPSMAVNVATPKISNDNEEYWYYVKNMSNRTNNKRGLSSLYASKENATVGANIVPMFRTQRWKLVDVNGKIGVVNEKGLYLNDNMKAVTIPFGWTLEKVTQEGSTGYRFAHYKNGELIKVAHLNQALSLIDYKEDDGASVWQFVPTDLIKESNDIQKYNYHINSLYFEDESLLGSSLKANDSDIVVTDLNSKYNWNFVDINKANGSCHIIANNNGKYLSTENGRIVLSETPKRFFIYMVTHDGLVGYKIATLPATSAPALNMFSSEVLNFSSVLSSKALWNFVPSINTGVQIPEQDKYNISVVNREIVVDIDNNFKVFNINGQIVVNKNLKPGVYIVKGKYFASKVIVE